MTTFLKAGSKWAAALLLLPLLNGCLATYGVQEQQTAQQEDIAILQEKIRRLEGRLEGFDLAIQQLQRAVETMRAQPLGPSVADLQTLQTRLSALDGQLRTLDAARQKDRQEIVDTLSSKIATLVSASAGSRNNAARAATSQGKRTANQEGYEHVVASGETLSAIAAAYNARTKDIIDANNITNPAQLRVGQKLFIPAP
jgi:LysM repeat protein